MSKLHSMLERKVNIFLKQKLRTPKLETGFSMLEAVVVVGVLLALAVSGFIAYGSITANAKTAKVKAAASEVHTAVVVASIDGDSNTQPDDVVDNWNDSTKQIHVEILEPRTGDDFCIKAFNAEDPDTYALNGDCSNVTGGGTGSADDIDGDGIPNASDPDIDDDGIPNASDPTPNGETGGTGGGNDNGSWNAISFTPITSYADGHDPVLIQYMNTELKYEALNVTGMSDEELYSSPEYIAWDTEYPTAPGKYAEYRNIIGRNDNASISAKRLATYAASDEYYSNPSEATHRTYVETMSDYYITAAATSPAPNRPMLPGAPGEFDDRIVAAGSTDNIIVNYKTPAGLINASNMENFDRYEHTSIDGQSAYGSNILTVTPEDGSYLLTVTFLAPDGGWPAGEHEIAVGQTDLSTRIIYYSTMKLTVQ